MKIFKENLTSKILQSSSSKLINKFKKKRNILEIGCGDGNITNYVIKKRKKNHSFFLSDVSGLAIKKAKQKIKFKNCQFKIGKWLDPWGDKKFDVIISDVSSINDFIAKESDWYDGVVCDSGDDGLKNIFKILSSIEKNLKKNGHFILPIISLSNEKELIRLLKRRFKKISFSKKVYWPLSDFFKKKINRYKKLKEESKINFEEKFGIFLAYSYSAECCGLK